MNDNTEAAAPFDVPAKGHVQAPKFSMAPEQRARLIELTEAFAKALDSKRSMMGRVDSMRRAKEAAQADAAAARSKWRERLRDGDGTITREVQKLRVTERSALALVEEYELLEAEITKGLAALDLQAAENAARCISATNAAVAEGADQAYAHAVKQAGDTLALAFSLYCKAANADQTVGSRCSVDGLAAAFFGRLSDDVRSRSATQHVEDQVKLYMGLPPIELKGVDAALLNSPALRVQLRQKINAESVE